MNKKINKLIKNYDLLHDEIKKLEESHEIILKKILSNDFEEDKNEIFYDALTYNQSEINQADRFDTEISVNLAIKN